MNTAQIPRKIVICGNYGAVNLGDEALLDGIISLIRRFDVQSQITVLSSDPKQTKRLHKVESTYLFPAGVRSFLKGIFDGRIIKTFRTVRQCDVFILGGGGLFTDEKLMAILIWSLQAALAHVLRKPIFCLGQSVGPLHTFLGKRMTKWVFSKAKMVTVRDHASARLLEKLNIPSAHVLADPAFCLHQEEPLAVKNEPYVVFSVRPWIKGDNENLYKICAQFIDWLWAQYGLKSILIPFQVAVDNDLNCLNKIFDQTKSKEAVEIYEFTDQYRNIIELLSRARAVIGMRLHSLIFSTLTQTPFLALSYSTKVTQFVDELELNDYLLNWEKLDLSSLQQRFELLLKNYEHIRSLLIEKNLIMRSKAHEHEALLRNFIQTA